MIAETAEEAHRRGRSEVARELQPVGYAQALEDVEAAAVRMFKLDGTAVARVRWVLDEVRGER